jgi:hypothetical protein
VPWLALVALRRPRPRSALAGRRERTRRVVYEDAARSPGAAPRHRRPARRRAWQQGEWAGRLHAAAPIEGAAPSPRTELKILYGEKHVYFAIRAFDDPALVHRYRAGATPFVGDIVGVCFDSYNDRRTGFEFDLTAGGSKIDLILGNGETEWDKSWDASGTARWPTTSTAGRRSSACRSTSCASARRTSRSGACTPGAGSSATRRRTSGS